MYHWRGQLKYLFADAGWDKIFYRGPLRLVHDGDYLPIIGGFDIGGADVPNAVSFPATPKESRTR